MRRRFSMAGWATLWLGAIALLGACVHALAEHYIASRWLAAVLAGLVLAPLVAWSGNAMTRRWSRVACALTDGISSLKDRDFSVSVTNRTPDELGAAVDAY